ncbi:MAG: aspartate-semialdehyde dehydrogenase [Clostridiales bacterium]|nr:aspartate-semialdehyde dehydrogenase [Clostridiales bacterium]
MDKKLRVGIIGATGMVGQRFVSLLADHPWFEITALAASARSAGRSYEEAMEGRWLISQPMPEKVKKMPVIDAADYDNVAEKVDFVFCAVNMSKEETRALEDAYVLRETPVVSNNSAHRMTPDVPMILPEVNAHHLPLIEVQRKRYGVKRGFITVKPNCSIQSYVPALTPLKEFGLDKVMVSTYQAISGAGKTFETFPEIIDNIIPFISGEEEKSEKEPLRIWGELTPETVIYAQRPVISAQCLRVPVSDGHTASVFVKFDRKPTKEQILEAWAKFEGDPQKLNLPSAPKQLLKYFEEDNRPQAKLDRMYENGMGITIGRLREDEIFDYKFVGLSHNTLRGAAGGAVLTAELLVAKGYIEAK